MTINKMHIEVNLGAQGLGPSRFDDFLEEEIDVALNSAQDRIVKQIYNPSSPFRPLGFEQSQKRIDDLSALIRTKEIQTYKATNGYEFSANFNAKIANVPNDYMFAVSYTGKVEHNNCLPISKTTSKNSYSYYAFTLPDLPTYDDFNLYKKESGVVSSILKLDVPKSLMGTDGKENLIYWLTLEGHALQSGFSAYYEKFDSLNLPGQIIIVSTNSSEGVLYSTTLPPISSINNYLGFTSSYTNEKLVSPVIEVNRIKFVQQQDLDILLHDPFNTTSIKDPLFKMGNRNLTVYESAIFIIERVFLTYLKVPRKISLSLGLDCELPEHLQKDIVKEAVQILLGDTGNPRVRQAEGDIQRLE